MATTQEILSSLEALVRQGSPLAAAWHVVVLAALAFVVARRWRPSVRVAAVLSSLPLLSAALAAGLSGNAFNALVVGAFAAALLIIGSRLPSRAVGSPRGSALLLGGSAVAYALAYPHFIEGGLGERVLFAPVGVLPCPSLALVVGLGLNGGGFGSRAWRLSVGAGGIAYAVFGALRLGVCLRPVIAGMHTSPGPPARIDCFVRPNNRRDRGNGLHHRTPRAGQTRLR